MECGAPIDWVIEVFLNHNLIRRLGMWKKAADLAGLLFPNDKVIIEKYATMAEMTKVAKRGSKKTGNYVKIKGLPNYV